MWEPSQFVGADRLKNFCVGSSSTRLESRLIDFRAHAKKPAPKTVPENSNRIVRAIFKEKQPLRRDRIVSFNYPEAGLLGCRLERTANAGSAERLGSHALRQRILADEKPGVPARRTAGTGRLPCWLLSHPSAEWPPGSPSPLAEPVPGTRREWPCRQSGAGYSRCSKCWYRARWRC